MSDRILRPRNDLAMPRLVPVIRVSPRPERDIDPNFRES
jgi:hypothetical protein